MSRPRNAWRRVKDVAYVLGWLLFGGCAQPTVPASEMAAVTRASVCKLAIDGHIEKATSCSEAQLAIDADPSCKEFGHLDLQCPEFRGPK